MLKQVALGARAEDFCVRIDAPSAGVDIVRGYGLPKVSYGIFERPINLLKPICGNAYLGFGVQALGRGPNRLERGFYM